MKTFLVVLSLFVSLTAFADPSRSGGNPCLSDVDTIHTLQGVTAGTTLAKIGSGVALQQIYVCSLNVQGVSGTNPTFSLSYGTGANCATGSTSITPSFATAAGTLLPFSGPITIVPPGKDLCYLDGGTTPVQNYLITYIQK